MGVLVHTLTSLFWTVWERMSYENPHLFPDQSEKVQGEYLTDFYSFLRYPPDSESMFQASCGIHTARPQVCRVFPLGRWGLFPADPDSLFSTLTEERVVLQKQICPSRVFTQGTSRTASQFLQDQRVDEYEYTIYSCVGEFLQQHSGVFASWSPEDIQQVYQRLIHQMYYTQSYSSDIEVFYQHLHSQLGSFVQGFHELHQRIKKRGKDLS